MVGLVIVSHGDLAKGLLDAAQMIVGPQEQVEAVGLEPGEGLYDLRERIREAVSRVDRGAGYLILADVKGGTPSNAACLLMNEKSGFNLVAGVNLPMLLEILCARESVTLEELVATAVQSGRDGVLDIAAELKAMQRPLNQEA